MSFKYTMFFSAYGHVLIGAGLVDEAVEYFTSLIQV